MGKVCNVGCAVTVLDIKFENSFPGIPGATCLAAKSKTGSHDL
jgi:hypothetical protein